MCVSLYSVDCVTECIDIVTVIVFNNYSTYLSKRKDVVLVRPSFALILKAIITLS